MTELSRRAAQKLAAHKGLVFQEDVVCKPDGEIVRSFDPAEYYSKPDFWAAVIGFLQEAPEPGTASAHRKGEAFNAEPMKLPARHRSESPIEPGASDKPMPMEGHFAKSGYCHWPGLDGHGHVLCGTLPVGATCVCGCHKNEEGGQ